MAEWKDSVKADYDDLKKRFKGTTTEDFMSGDWFAQFVSWMLTEYAKTVDAAYIKRMYPGAHPANQSRKAISLAARYSSVAGGGSAAAITALEMGSIGPQAALTVPAIAGLVFADVAYTTRVQLRTTYDLSVIQQAPLSVDDVEDCYLVFLTAMGAKFHEMAGGLGKAVGPQIVAYNVRKLLRTGFRKTLQEILKRVGGTWLAKQLTERAMMRLLVPGISVPIAMGFNYYFTRRVLNVANTEMIRRGAVVQPLIRLYKRSPDLENTFAIKALIAVLDAGDAEGWSLQQMDVLRHCQTTLSLTDGDLKGLDQYFDRSVAEFTEAMPKLNSKAVDDLIDLLTVAASMFPDAMYDAAYAAAVGQIARASGADVSDGSVAKRIHQSRKKLA